MDTSIKSSGRKTRLSHNELLPYIKSDYDPKFI